ncbi:hypothetical protein [Planctomicrobium sp. SH527]|uniref:hypothetical protein n=1 Tax=Planctomicrobium sp. SH527 TaxID=3448123 RepID=UPI003F5C7241
MKADDDSNAPNSQIRHLDRFINWAYDHPILLLEILLLIGVLPLSFTWFRLLFPFPDKWQILSPHEIGDTFGFLNAITSSLAFIGVLATLYMQREELSLQRQEMRESREELRRSAEAQAQSEKRLAAAAALNALESLRASAQTKTGSDDVDLSIQSEFASAKIAMQISSILSDLGMLKSNLINSEEIRAVEELHSFIIPLISVRNHLASYLTFIPLIKECLNKHKDKAFSQSRSFILEKSKVLDLFDKIIKSNEPNNRALFANQHYKSDDNSTIVGGSRDPMFMATNHCLKTLLTIAIRNLASENKLLFTNPVEAGQAPAQHPLAGID